MGYDVSETTERLWVPVVAPALWALHFTLCYATAAMLCGRFGPSGAVELRVAIAAYTGIAMVAMGALFAHGLRRHRYQLPTRPHDDDSPEDRRHFLAFTTMLLAGLSLLATAFVAGAVFLVAGCA